MRLSALGNDDDANYAPTIDEAINTYEARDAARIPKWKQAFGR